MLKSPRFFVVLGCILLAIAVILKVMGFSNPCLLVVIKPSSFLILANTAFVLAILLKK